MYKRIPSSNIYSVYKPYTNVLHITVYETLLSCDLKGKWDHFISIGHFISLFLPSLMLTAHSALLSVELQ